MQLDLDTGRATVVTHPPPGTEGDTEPKASPDGRWLAFTRKPTDLNGRPVVMDLRSGAERELDFGLDVDSVVWAEDSKSLFAVANDPSGGRLILAKRLSGGPAERIYATPSSLGRIAAGPHGLLAAEINTVRFNIAEAVAGETAEPDLIDASSQTSWSPVFTADGALATVSDRSGEVGIWTLRPGSPPRQILAIGAKPAYGLAWSHDGARLAFVSPVSGRPGIRVIRPDGGPVAEFQTPGNLLGRLSWSGDDRALIFMMRQAQGSRIWRAPLDQPGKLEPISDFGWTDAQTRGNEVYAVRSGAHGVWRLGSPPVLVAADAPRVQLEQWTPANTMAWTIAGDQIIYADVTGQNRFRVMAQPISGGPAKQVGWAPAFRPNGELAFDPRTGKTAYVAIVSGDTDIELLNLARK
jgi:Tol biopolymer transport system component